MLHTFVDLGPVSAAQVLEKQTGRIGACRNALSHCPTNCFTETMLSHGVQRGVGQIPLCSADLFWERSRRKGSGGGRAGRPFVDLRG